MDKKNSKNAECCNSSDLRHLSQSLIIHANDLNNNVSKQKNDGKIRIYFYGENLIDKMIKYEIKPPEQKISENNINYFKGFNIAFNWEYFIFNEITEESNKIIGDLIINDFEMRDFYDIIIITVNNLLDEKSKIFFKYFQNCATQKASQPFILYLTKEEENPQVENLYKLITNEDFDKRNLFALKYPLFNKENEKKSFLEQICRFRNYFHEEGDSYESYNEELYSDYKFNILVCGKAGTGKSSFINKFLNDKKAKEGEGLSVTHQIVSYNNKEYPINISDTPGFENEETVQEVIELLDAYNKKLIDARKKINLIIYFFQYTERTVLSMEIPLLEKLIKYKTEIIFVINFVTESIEKNHYKRIHKICKDSLKNIFPEDFEIKIFPINLFSQIDDDNSDKIKIIKEFGLDNLFKGIYNIFKDNVINIKEINSLKNAEDLFNLFLSNKLYNHFKEVNDIFISIRSELSNLILSYGRLNRLSFNKAKNMKLMANLIYKKSIGKNCEKFEEYLRQLSSEEKIEELFQKFSKNLDILRLYNKKIHSMYFYESIHDHETLALGYLCLNELEKLFESNPNIFLENDKINLDLITNLCNSFNRAINGFNELAHKYEDYYQKEYNDKINLEDDAKIEKINKEIDEPIIFKESNIIDVEKNKKDD